MTKKKKTSGKTTTKKVKPVKKFTVDELEGALFEAEQDFQRAVLKMMLLGETLRSIKEENEIRGSKVELGILKTRLTKEVAGWFKEFGYDVSDKLISKQVKGVPIEIKIIKKNWPFFQHLDTVFYKTFDAIDIPNPWQSCFNIRGLIR